MVDAEDRRRALIARVKTIEKQIVRSLPRPAYIPRGMPRQIAAAVGDAPLHYVTAADTGAMEVSDGHVVEVVLFTDTAVVHVERKVDEGRVLAMTVMAFPRRDLRTVEITAPSDDAWENVCTWAPYARARLTYDNALGTFEIPLNPGQLDDTVYQRVAAFVPSLLADLRA